MAERHYQGGLLLLSLISLVVIALKILLNSLKFSLVKEGLL